MKVDLPSRDCVETVDGGAPGGELCERPHLYASGQDHHRVLRNIHGVRTYDPDHICFGPGLVVHTLLYGKQWILSYGRAFAN